MRHTHIVLQGVSATALLIVVSAASAQEALPTIDVGAAQPVATGPGGEGQGTSPGVSSSKATLDQNSGDRLTGYDAPNATSALKTDTPILQTPVSVQVVTRETLDDQQAITIQDAITNNTSSVYSYNPNYPTAFVIRGFVDPNFNVYVNGLPLGSTFNFDTSNVESFEVLKGPASILYGRVEPGGLVTSSTKRPLETPYYSFQEQAGSFGETRTSIDATGPLTADKTWLYRINTTFERQGSFVDFASGRNIFVNGVVTYHPDEQFKLNIETSYTNVLQPFPNGNVAVGNKPQGLPRSEFLGDPLLTSTYPNSQQRGMFGYDWTYNFTKDWSLTQRFRYVDEHDFSSLSYLYLPIDIYGNATAENFWGTQQFYSTVSNLDLKGKFDTGPLTHAVLIGADFNHTYSPVDTTILGPTYNINIFHPIYGLSGFSFNSPSNFPTYAGYNTQWQGVYGQDLISALDDSVHLLFGGRYDWAGGQTCYGLTHDQAPASCSGYFDKAFSPRIGVVYQPMPWFSVYGSFSKGFSANNGVSQLSRQALPPEKGQQWEGGAKAEFFDKRLLATIAYFDILKSNIPYADPTNPTNTLLIPGAESEGLEAELKGKVNDNWSLIANYTHDYTKVVAVGSPPPAYYPTEVASEAPVVGNHLQSIPTNSGNLWVKYDADGEWKGLSVAGGMLIAGSASGDNANSFQLPAYRVFNGMIAYAFPWEGTKVTAQLNIKNLFDTTYYTSAGTRSLIGVGAPRTILASLRVEYGDKSASARLPGQRGIFDDILPTRKAPSESAFNWSGLYAGGSAGYGRIESSSVTGFENATEFGYAFPTGATWTYSGPTPKGFGGGGVIGANVQFADRIVTGLEADLQTLHMKGDSGGVGVGAFDPNTGNFYAPVLGTNQAIYWYGTGRARLGYSVLPTLLLYGTGGFAFANTASSFSYLDTRGNVAQRGTPGAVMKGWTWGGGIEWAFLPNWSAKVEYQNVDLGFGSAFGTGPAGTIAEFGPANSGAVASSFSLQHSGVANHFSTIKIGLNYHFGLFGDAGPSLGDYLPRARPVEMSPNHSAPGIASSISPATTADGESPDRARRSNLQGAPNQNTLGWTGLANYVPNGKAPPPLTALVPVVPSAPRLPWTGLYAGLNIGGVFSGDSAVKTRAGDLFDDTGATSSFGVPTLFGGASAASAATPVSVNNAGILGGVQFGYNYQFSNNVVAGLEADIQGGALSGTASAGGVAVEAVTGVPVTTTSTISKRLDYLNTVRSRLGYLATPTMLLYGTGGFAYGNAVLTNSLSQIPLDPTGIAGVASATPSVSKTLVGWTAGAGVEWMFHPNWSARVEYLYYDLGSVSGGAALLGSDKFLGTPLYASAVQSSTHFNGQAARIGLNYHFHFGAAAPVVAKY